MHGNPKVPKLQRKRPDSPAFAFAVQQKLFSVNLNDPASGPSISPIWIPVSVSLSLVQTGPFFHAGREVDYRRQEC